MSKSQKSEAEIAADKILVELPKRNQRLAQFLTKEVDKISSEPADPFERKLKKLQILAALNAPLLQEIVSALSAQHGPSGKTSFSPKSMISFMERMPSLTGEDIMRYKEMFGGNYHKL